MSSSNGKKTMKALVFGKNHAHIEVQSKTVPIPALTSKNSLLIRILFVGLNPVDAKQVTGDKLPQGILRRWFHQYVVHDTVIGLDFAGTVEESNTDEFKKGDEVFGTVPPLRGTLQEYVATPSHQVYKKPTTLSWEEAAAFPLVGLTCFQALKPYRHCNSILVLGASSGTGHMALQIAERMGYSTRIGVCSGRNMDWVKEHCRPTHTIDYTKGSVYEKTKQIMGEDQVDIVFDCVTSEDAHDRSVQYPKTFLPLTGERYIRLGGRFHDWILAGFERKEGVRCFGKEKLFWIKFPHSSDHLRQLQEWADDDGAVVKPRVHKVVEDMTVEAVQQAMDDLIARGVAGKIVVKVM